MKAAVQREWGGSPSLEEVPVPAARPGETIVAMIAAAVAPLDIDVLDGRFPIRPSLPFVPGVEGAGVALSGPYEGKMVRIHGGGLGLRRPGTWGEATSVPDRAVTFLPQDLDPLIAAAFGVPVLTAHVALGAVGAMQEGERIAVAGASGAVGSMVVQLALRRGAKEVVCILRNPTRARLLPKEAIFVEEDKSWKEIDPVDLLVDMVGGAGFARRLGLVRSGGRVALVGYASGPLAQLDLPEFMLRNVSILPVNMMHHNTDDEAEVLHEAAASLASGELSFHVEPFALDDVAECVRKVRSGETHGRPVLTI